MTNEPTGTLRDIHRQFKRLHERVTELHAQHDIPAIDNAFTLADRALNQVTRQPHTPTRQSDEYFCSACGCRWAADEDEPEATCVSITDRIESVKRHIQGIEMSGKPHGYDKDRYQALKQELKSLEVLADANGAAE